jgi:hypothetical protein
MGAFCSASLPDPSSEPDLILRGGGSSDHKIVAYPRLWAAYVETSGHADDFDIIFSAFLVPENVILKHIVEEHLSSGGLRVLGPPLFDIQACAYRGIDLTGIGEVISQLFVSSADSRYQSLLAKTLNLICDYQPNVRITLSDPSLVDALARNPSKLLDSLDIAFPTCRDLYERLLAQIGGTLA